MAKKKTQFNMILDAKFKIAVSEDKFDNLISEISEGKACLSVSIPYDDGIDLMMSLYSDQVKEGCMSISNLSREFAEVVISGYVIRDLDPKFDADFIVALNKKQSLKINCTAVCDNDVNNYYIDGNDEAHVCIGKCSPIK